MQLVIQHLFLLGRFHATRWNQNPFEDIYGEWPPSPWRLMRALTARWFQYVRETGEQAEDVRNGLLNKLATTVPSFFIPEATWPGVSVRQYHPLGLEKKYEATFSYKQVGTTLVQDNYRAVPPDRPILWVWEETDLSPAETALLGRLIRRVIYFGRAESHCRFRVIEGDGVAPNCRLTAAVGAGNPVLVPVPGADLNFETLLANTDSSTLKSRRIPAGTAWYYAAIPPRPAARPVRPVRRRHPQGLHVLQFAVGGRVYPPLAHWVKLTERFRDRVIRERCRQLTGRHDVGYADLNPAQRDQLRLLRGIDGDSGRVDGQTTAFFALIPGAHDQPIRLACWRESPFTDDEIDAFLAAEYPIRWEYGGGDWQLRLVPLPFTVPQPAEYWGPGRAWESVTPFVLPAGRHRLRWNGRPRAGETPAVSLQKLAVRFGLPEPQVELRSPEPMWVTIHETPGDRGQRARALGTRMRPGHLFRLIFPEPVAGPLCVGHSCHFGLGLFSNGG